MSDHGSRYAIIGDIMGNHGTVVASRQAGVTHVEVSDGDDDEACAHANGQVWTLEEALANPVAHPNCTRSFSPVEDPDA